MDGTPASQTLGAVPIAKVFTGIVPENLKRCPKCKLIKNRTEFHKYKGSKDGLYPYCKDCNKKKRADWYVLNADIRKEKDRIYRIENNEKVTKGQRDGYRRNREKILLKKKQYLKENKEEINKRRREKFHNEPERQKLINARNRAWYEKNKDKDSHKNMRKEYREKNVDKLKEKHRLYNKSRDRDIVNARARKWRNKNKDVQNEKLRIRRNNNITKKISNNISTAIRDSLHGMKAGRRWETLVGYTVEDVKTHLEDLFCDGMGWEDFLKGKIHIDHIHPIASFNFTNTEDLDFKLCWSLSNLQPLWATDNLRKGCKLDYVIQRT